MRFYNLFLLWFLLGLTQALQAGTTPNAGYVYASNGRLYFPSGKELCLWGVNFQPSLSWEYNSRLKPAGISLDLDEMKRITDNSFDEIQRMGANMIRCHITPADFTDDNGNLVETIYLELLDYVVSEAAKRNIYVYLTFINHMGSGYTNNSMMYNLKYQDWIYNKDVVRKTSNYIRQLLDRENIYSGTKYSLTKTIALWEIINEPRYYSYDKLIKTDYYADFKKYCQKNNCEDNEKNYLGFRKELVLSYINGMYDVIRKTGAKQPIVWNCNWHKMRVGLEDVFDAISDSKVEVVSFCNYPGQDVCKNPYYDNPQDLTNYDFSQYFSNCYNNFDWYGWTKSLAFKEKAKVVYEYEAFYSQSQYVYPAQAHLFRSLGVQAAAMWTYSLSGSSQYINGSHNLSITCTPAKAAAFLVAKEIFSSLPLYANYDLKKPSEERTDNYIIPYNRNLGVYSSMEKLCYTHSIDTLDILQSREVKEIHGIGSSKVAQYDGLGLYNVFIFSDKIYFTIEPDAFWVKQPWMQDKCKSIVTLLDYQSTHHLSLDLSDFSSNKFIIYKLINKKKKKIAILNSLKNITVNAGYYTIEKI